MDNFNKIKELNDVISVANIELKEMLKNGKSKENFSKKMEQKLIWELELAELNLADFNKKRA